MRTEEKCEYEVLHGKSNGKNLEYIRGGQGQLDFPLI